MKDIDVKLDRLRGLIGIYWCLAYAEGEQRRSHDTETGDAQACSSAMEEILREIKTALTPPDGWVLVPVRATDEMLEQFKRPRFVGLTLGDRYARLLAARPEVK